MRRTRISDTEIKIPDRKAVKFSASGVISSSLNGPKKGSQKAAAKKGSAKPAKKKYSQAYRPF
ncbi:MAG: hypothetical protein A4E57_04480 [Syntrophorhabdaceae bacterium PtaU1.Bin034]|jgi:hypothetical protein|nr:MAG: hypothetical protein A4E57_04480 [Syntrophorhabdaceae bacterium PtaU1.Bin034]